jgi:hypothetical protein
MKYIISAHNNRNLFCVTTQKMDYQYRLQLTRVLVLHTDSLPTTALVLQISAPFQPTTSVSFDEYDDVSCLFFPSTTISKERNKELSISNDEYISGVEEKKQQNLQKQTMEVPYSKHEHWLQQNILRSKT